MKKLYIILLVLSLLLNGSVGRIGMDIVKNTHFKTMETSAHSCCKVVNKISKESKKSKDNCCNHQGNKVCCCFVLMIHSPNIQIPVVYQYITKKVIFANKNLIGNYNYAIFHPPIV